MASSCRTFAKLRRMSDPRRRPSLSFGERRFVDAVSARTHLWHGMLDALPHSDHGCSTRSVDLRPLEIPIAPRGARQLPLCGRVPRPSLLAGVVGLVCWLCPVSLGHGVLWSFRGNLRPLPTLPPVAISAPLPSLPMLWVTCHCSCYSFCDACFVIPPSFK